MKFKDMRSSVTLQLLTGTLKQSIISRATTELPKAAPVARRESTLPSLCVISMLDRFFYQFMLQFISLINSLHCFQSLHLTTTHLSLGNPALHDFSNPSYHFIHPIRKCKKFSLVSPTNFMKRGIQQEPLLHRSIPTDKNINHE